MCQLLLEYGADISQRDVVGATPLIHAAARGATAAVQLLLGSKAGANLGRQWLLQQATAGGETALMAAAKGGHLDTLQVIRAAASCCSTALTCFDVLHREILSGGPPVHCMAGGPTQPSFACCNCRRCCALLVPTHQQPLPKE
jgi:hypothetical protein